jgi:hypothetical protein
MSSCVTDSAPWRKAVPTQSEAVSPPPMTTTFLPEARIGCSPLPRIGSALTRRLDWTR